MRKSSSPSAFPVTPAIRLLQREKVAHQVLSYIHDPNAGSFGREAAAKLALDPTHVFKTLLATTDGGELVVALVPVSGQLDLKALAAAAGGRKCTMANAEVAERSSGYVVGGISPLGQKKQLRTFIDAGAQSLETMYVSAGKRGLDVALAPADLARLTQAQFVAIGKPV